MKTKYFPIIVTKELNIQNTVDLKNTLESQNLQIDTSLGELLIKPGNWVVSKFGTSNLYSTLDVFTNAHELSLGGLKLPYILDESGILKILEGDSSKFFIDKLEPNVLRKEISQFDVPAFNLHYIETNIDRFDLFVKSCNTLSAKNPAEIILPELDSSTTNIDLDDVIGKYKVIKIGEDTVFEDAEKTINEILGDDESYLKMKIESYSTSMEESEESDYEMEEKKTREIDVLKDFSLFIPEEKPQTIIISDTFNMKKRNVKASKFISNLQDKKMLWENVLDLVMRKMFIKDIYISKFILMVIGVYFVKYPNYQEFITDNFYKKIFIHINEMINNNKIYPDVEYFFEYNFSLRLENKKIVIREAAILTLAEPFDKEDLVDIIIQDNMKGYQYVGIPTHFERKLSNDNYSKILHKIEVIHLSKEIYFRPIYDPLLYALKNTHFLITKLDARKSWF
jgi:hypothetical protein